MKSYVILYKVFLKILLSLESLKYDFPRLISSYSESSFLVVSFLISSGDSEMVKSALVTLNELNLSISICGILSELFFLSLELKETFAFLSLLLGGRER